MSLFRSIVHVVHSIGSGVSLLFVVFAALSLLVVVAFVAPALQY